MGLFDRISNIFHKKDEVTKFPEQPPEKIAIKSSGPVPDPNSEIKSVILEATQEEVREIPNVYRCRTCGKTFESEVELENHHKSQYSSSEPVAEQNQEEYVCEVCGKKFDNEFELDYHHKTQPEIHEAYDDKWDLMVSSETVEEKNFTEQHDAILNLKEVEIPVSKNCYICGILDYPPFEGRDGKYYCREHILPENRGTGERGKPLSESPGSLVYHPDGKIEFKL
jgi:DNA-directed RNA polymerase subunit RPC12/RpoP